jgi:hypothetical protein
VVLNRSVEWILSSMCTIHPLRIRYASDSGLRSRLQGNTENHLDGYRINIAGCSNTNGDSGRVGGESAYLSVSSRYTCSDREEMIFDLQTRTFSIEVPGINTSLCVFKMSGLAFNRSSKRRSVSH